MGEEMILFEMACSLYLYLQYGRQLCLADTLTGVASGEALFLHWMFLSWTAAVKL